MNHSALHLTIQTIAQRIGGIPPYLEKTFAVLFISILILKSETPCCVSPTGNSSPDSA